MKSYIQRLAQKIKGKGFFEIILSSTIAKAMMFLSTMFLPRFLSVDAYGSLTYAETILNYFLLLSGLGLGQATLKFCVMEENKEKKNDIFGAALVIGCLFNLCISVVFYLIIRSLKLEIAGSKELVQLMTGIPILSFIFQNFQFYLRANFENKKYSILSVTYAIFYVGAQICSAIFIGVKGVVCARYFSYALCIIGALFLTRTLYQVRFNWPKKEKIKQMVVFSITILFGNFFSIAITNNETLLIGSFFKKPDLLASYKVGSYILQICAFFLEAVIVFVLPYFAKNVENKRWIWKNVKRLFFVNMIFMTLIISVLFIFANLIITILWGTAYLSSVHIMRTLLIASWAQTVFRAIPGNVLAIIGEEKFTLKVNVITCILHLAVDYILFYTVGESIVGAGLICAYLFSGICMSLKIWRKCTGEVKVYNKKNRE